MQTRDRLTDRNAVFTFSLAESCTAEIAFRCDLGRQMTGGFWAATLGAERLRWGRIAGEPQRTVLSVVEIGFAAS